MATAWRISEISNEPIHDLSEARERIREVEGVAGEDTNDCHAYPEIAAAVQSFVISPSARTGLYIYFDVGGGTSDGVSFRFDRDDGLPRIDFYGGEIESMGVEALIGRHSETDPDSLAVALFDDETDERLVNALEEDVKAIRKQVAKVVIAAKQKDPEDWLREAQFSDWYLRTKWGFRNFQRRPLWVFLGGGGGDAPFYQRAVMSTYEAHGHSSAGIPPYEIGSVPMPADFELGTVPESEFHRFAIAYGLSVPLGEGPEIRLPSEFDELHERTVREITPVGVYDD